MSEHVPEPDQAGPAPSADRISQPANMTSVEPTSSPSLPIQARVLVVDDDPIMRLQLTRQVGKIVTEVSVAANGIEGLNIWRQWQPDVVITDLLMPHMDGLEMSAAIKSENPAAQIVVISSVEETEPLRRALEIGVERYLGKPIDFHLLTDAISKCVRDHRQIEELRLTRQVASLSDALKEQLVEKQRTEEALRKEKAEHLVLIGRLEEAHNQLLQSEKLASIGQLAAGVAHEINNPVGFVNSNLGSLRQYIENLLRMLYAYESHESEFSPDSQAEIAALREELDIEFLKTDVFDLFSESQGGLQRVTRIVQDLKDFSHVSDMEMHLADLEKCLESTLNVVWNEIKYKAEVVRDYASIPEVECIPSQLNQVFMNLLINAAHAIPQRGTITIRTRQQGDNVHIEIADTGTGIPPDIMNRIFDPFFTTKPVGKGTGLGLSIAHGIVLKHKGRIKVDSQPGMGTRFVLILPIRQ